MEPTIDLFLFFPTFSAPPPSFSPLQVLGVSVLSCSLWILFSSGHLLNVLPSGNSVVGVTVAMTTAGVLVDGVNVLFG